MIGEYLGRDKDLSQKINLEFFGLFHFQNIVIDMAFRSIFKKLRLPKESQQIERIIKGFALGYWEDNQVMLTCKLHPNWNLECVEFLALSILVLNTTYHSDKIPKSLKLSKENFIKTNESYLKELTNYQMLSDIYDRIVRQQFEAKIDI